MKVDNRVGGGGQCAQSSGFAEGAQAAPSGYTHHSRAFGNIRGGLETQPRRTGRLIRRPSEQRHEQ